MLAVYSLRSVEPRVVSSAERRLQQKLGPNTHIVAWGRAWVSRDGRMHAVFAARTLDFAVLTAERGRGSSRVSEAILTSAFMACGCKQEW